jgi:O-antigen ligase
MIGVFAGAMMIIMALVVFGGVIPCAGVNPLLLSPAFGLTILLAVAFAIHLLVGRPAAGGRPLMQWPVLVFVAYAIVRYLTSPFEYEARNELLQIALCALTFFVAAHQFHRRQDRAVFIAVLAVLAVLQSSYAMWQAFTRSDVVLFWERPETYSGRGSGTFVCPNHLAGFLEMLLGLLLARAVIVRRESQSVEKAVLLKVLLIYAALMAVAGILVSQSRAGWAATVMSSVALLFLGEWGFRSVLPRAALVMAVLGFMGMLLWGVAPVRSYVFKPPSEKTTSQSLAFSDPSLGGRVVMWTGTMRMIRDAPWFGTGIGSWQWVYQQYKRPDVIVSEPDYTHNDFLNLAADYGLVGAGMMLAIFIGFFRHAWCIARRGQNSDQRAFAIGAMTSVISILVHSWFDFNLHIPANSLLLAAIMGFTAAMTEQPRPVSDAAVRPYGRFAASAALFAACGLSMWLFVPTVMSFHFTDLGNGPKMQLDYDTALAYYERASAWDPRYPAPHIWTGDIHLSQANWRRGPAKTAERRELARKAVQAYDRALLLNPRQAYVRVSLAYAHELAGNDDLALHSYQQAIATSPLNAYAHYKLGVFHRDRGRDKEAYEAFARAHEHFNYTDSTFQMNAWEAHEKQRAAQPK